MSSRSSQPSVAAAASRGAQPVQPAQVLDLLADEHARVQAALLGHVAEAAASAWPTGAPFQRTCRHRGR